MVLDIYIFFCMNDRKREELVRNPDAFDSLKTASLATEINFPVTR